MQDIWKRFARDGLGLAGLILIAVFVLAAMLAPWLAPYDPNEQFFDGLTLEGSPLPPGRALLVRHRHQRPRPVFPPALWRPDLAR